MIFSIWRFVILSIFALSGLTVQANDLPTVKPVRDPSPPYAARREVQEKVRLLLRKGDFESLDGLASRLRTSGVRLESGEWLLSIFYDAAVVVPEKEAEAREAQAFYERWAKDRPGSIAAKVCLALALVERGGQVLRGVGDQARDAAGARKLFASAWTVLEKAATLEEKCPGWYAAAQRIANSSNWSRPRYIKLVEEAIQREPTYGECYSLVCHWLTPSNRGKKGDLEEWIARQADKCPPFERDKQYARLVWLAQKYLRHDELDFSAKRLDWARTKRGFEDLLISNPGNLAVRSEFARLALIADDSETARSQFSELGGRFVSAIWKVDKEVFEKAQRFALQGEGENPLRKKEVERHKFGKIELDPETIVRIQGVLRLAERTSGGMLAGLWLLALAWQRGETKAGGAFGLLSIILAAGFGTAAAAGAAIGLWIYLRRANREIPPLHRAGAGEALLWVVVILCVVYAIQCVGFFLPVIISYLPNWGDRIEPYLTAASDGSGGILAGLNAFWIGFLVLLFACQPQSRDDWQECLGLRPCRLLTAGFWSVVILALVIGFENMLEGVVDERTKLAMEAISLLVHASPILSFLMLVVFAPVFEELVFRGFLFGAWQRKFGFWVAAIVSSVLFAIVHVQYGWWGILSIVAYGILLATLRWKTGSVYPCIGMHATINGAQWIFVMLGLV